MVADSIPNRHPRMGDTIRVDLVLIDLSTDFQNGQCRAVPACLGWVRSVDDMELVHEKNADIGELWFCLISQLFAHDRIFVASTAENTRPIGRQKSMLDRVAEVFDLDWRNGLRRLAGDAGSSQCSLRRTEIKLRSVHPLAGQAQFQKPKDLPKLFRQLWADARSVNCQNSALHFAASFLLIHPLVDGNGRSARLAFASLLWRVGLRDPRWLIGFAVMFDASDSGFQVGMVHFAAGQFSVLERVYMDACHKGEVLCADVLGRNIFRDFDSAIAGLEIVRGRLRAVMG